MHVCRPPQDNPKTLNTQLYIQLFEKKLARFEQFARLYPECYWIFVGDNGQVRPAAKPAAAMGQQQPCYHCCEQQLHKDLQTSVSRDRECTWGDCLLYFPLQPCHHVCRGMCCWRRGWARC